MSIPGGPQFAPPPSYVTPPAWASPPVPGLPPDPRPPFPSLPPRPASVTLAATLSVVASLQWVCGLGFAWMVASLGSDELERGGDTGALFHILNRFDYRMLDGLAWPLFLLPLVSFGLGFAILTRSAWTRIAYTAVGVIALAGSAWLLRNDLVWWVVPAVYIAIATGLVWTRAASAWFGGDRQPGHRPPDSAPSAR